MNDAERIDALREEIARALWQQDDQEYAHSWESNAETYREQADRLLALPSLAALLAAPSLEQCAQIAERHPEVYLTTCHGAGVKIAAAIRALAPAAPSVDDPRSTYCAICRQWHKHPRGACSLLAAPSVEVPRQPPCSICGAGPFASMKEWFAHACCWAAPAQPEPQSVSYCPRCNRQRTGGSCITCGSREPQPEEVERKEKFWRGAEAIGGPPQPTERGDRCEGRD